MLVKLHVFVFSPHLCGAGPLVGPGALAPYQGPREHVTYGSVSEWPAGFFVGGSTISAMNGLYAKSDHDHSLPHLHHHTYVNADSSWVLGYIQADGDGHKYATEGGLSNEWLLIGSNGEDRFAHEGDTFIPGAGRRWAKVHRQEYSSRFAVGDSIRTRTKIEGVWESDVSAKVKKIRSGDPGHSPVTIALPDGRQVNTQAWRLRRVVTAEQSVVSQDSLDAHGDTASNDDELPWQLVAIMDKDRFQKFLRQKREHDKNLRRSSEHLSNSLPALPPQGEEGPSAEVVIDLDAQRLCDSSQTSAGVEALDAALAFGKDSYTRAALYVQKASCLRQASDPIPAIEAADFALGLFPRYRHALFIKGLAILDASKPDEAVRTFETVLRIDPSWPGLRKWLLYSHARARRRGRGPVGPGLYVGDILETHATYDGLWGAGERAEVIGLGTCQAPLLVRMQATGRTINTQRGHFRPVPDDNAVSQSRALEDYYSLLGLRADFSADDLRRAYREASKKSHPDLGGSATIFQQVAEAHSVLGDPQRRQAYDEGEDLPQSDAPLHEEIKRRYFPDKVEFQPFGDPGKDRRKQEERERISDEMRKRLHDQEL